MTESKVTKEMIDAALPWLSNFQHMRATDKRNAVESAIAAALATQPQAPQGAVTDAERYKKLQRWMSSNVKEGWTEVENLGAIAAYMGWDAMDQALDGLPMCTVGLCSLPAAPKTETPEVQP